MEKIFLFLQLAMLIFFASCSSEDPEPIPQSGTEVENTIFVYIPWSGVSDTDSGLYSCFLTDMQDVESAIINQGGPGSKRLMIFIFTKVNRGALINAQYKNGSCADDTVAICNNKLAGLELNSAEWTATLLKRAKQEAPVKHYSVIIGCHGMGWTSAKSSTRLNRSIASPFGFNKDVGKPGPPARRLGGDAYQTNISESGKGIENSGTGKFQYILFDDYNMTGVEVAYELCNATHRVIGSPAGIMAYDMPYKLLWNELSKANPDYYNICTNFINSCDNYKYGNTPYPYGTISVIDRSQVEGMLNVTKEINASSPPATAVESDIQSMDGYAPSILYDVGDYVCKFTQNELQLLTRFDQQFGLLVPEKDNTTSYHTAIRSRSGDVIPIQTYFSIAIPDPSTNLNVASSLSRNRYYQATH